MLAEQIIYNGKRVGICQSMITDVKIVAGLKTEDNRIPTDRVSELRGPGGKAHQS